MKQFSEILKEAERLEGEKVKLDSILNQDIIIHKFSLANSNFSKNKSGKYVTVQFSKEENGERNVFFSGSDVLIDQLQRYKNEMPYQVQIKKVNKYYTLS
jgi:hypothetical protein